MEKIAFAGGEDYRCAVDSAFDAVAGGADGKTDAQPADGPASAFSRVDPVVRACQLDSMSAMTIPAAGKLRAFCQARGIHRLRLFGSGARSDFDPARSDVDLLVEYEPARHPGLDHFRVADELTELFGRKVDLNTPAMLGWHLEKILAETKVLYEEA